MDANHPKLPSPNNVCKCREPLFGQWYCIRPGIESEYEGHWYLRCRMCNLPISITYVMGLEDELRKLKQQM